MSATIPESMRLDDLLKATGYDCPAVLQGKTFDQATEGGGADLEDNKTVSITENGVVEITPSAGKDGMKKVTATINVSGGGGATKLYAWYSGSDSIYTTTPTPSVGDKVILSSDDSSVIEARQVYSVTEEGITIDDYEEATVYERYSRDDIDLV